MRRSTLILVILAALVAAALFGSSAPAAPTAAPTQEQAKQYLVEREAALEADLANTDRVRAALDVEVRADSRQLDNDLFPPILARDDLTAGARDAVQHAFDVRALPGPADSADKRLHTNERQAGSAIEQYERRELASVQDELALYP